MAIGVCTESGPAAKLTKSAMPKDTGDKPSRVNVPNIYIQGVRLNEGILKDLKRQPYKKIGMIWCASNLTVLTYAHALKCA